MLTCEAAAASYCRCSAALKWTWREKKKKSSLKASSWIGEPSEEVILKVEERINHVGRHLISNLKWLTAVSGAAINVYRFNSIGFKLGHTAIKSAKLVESSLTAVCFCLASTEAAVLHCGHLQQGRKRVQHPFQLNVHNGEKQANILNSRHAQSQLMIYF